MKAKLNGTYKSSLPLVDIFQISRLVLRRLSALGNERQNIFSKDSNVVMIFCDHGSRYMSKIYSDKWMNDQGFFDSEKTDLEKPIEYIK